MISTEVRVTRSKVKDNLLVFVQRVVLLIFTIHLKVTKVGTLIATRVYIILNIDFQVMVSKVKIMLLIFDTEDHLLIIIQTFHVTISTISHSNQTNKIFTGIWIWNMILVCFFVFVFCLFFYSFICLGGGGNIYSLHVSYTTRFDLMLATGVCRRLPNRKCWVLMYFVFRVVCMSSLVCLFL